MDALSRLAEALGIARSYHDAFGRHRDVPEATLRGICAALGFPAQDEAGAELSLSRYRAESGATLAPPVVVLRGDAAADIPLSLHATADATEVAWELRTEAGETRRGHAVWRDLPVDAARAVDDPRERRLLRIAERLPHGYHDLSLRTGGSDDHAARVRIVAAPACAYQPPPLAEGGRVWAVSTQLYSLMTPTDWGIGDFAALGDLLSYAGRSGAAGVGINPLHSLFTDEPERASPYSPASRLFLNPLYLSIPAIEDFAECEEAQRLVVSGDFRRRLAELRGKRLIDYSLVSTLKYQILHLLYPSFRARHLGDRSDPRCRTFREFQAAGGAALRRFAIFETLRAKFGAEDPSQRYWRHWPMEYRRPDTPEVLAFAQEHIEDVEFYEYLQWQAHLQLDEAARRADALTLGIYGDLAIGIDSGGADAWANQDVIAHDFSVGAPPDPWSHEGQNWGFPPLNPHALRRTGYRMFIDVLRANMRHAGALRIDHVLGFMRMFWVPADRPTAEGTYVAYPFDELVAVVILESHRNECLVIGEDLGTLPPGLREALAAAGLYSYRLVYFERDGNGEYSPPGRYPVLAAAAVTTHDLPTLTGFWSGADIRLREQFGFLPPGDARTDAHAERRRSRDGLVAAMRAANIPIVEPGDGPPRLAIHHFLARSVSRVVLVQLDDAIDEPDQINLPGTDREHPNWRRRYALSLAEIFADRRAQDLFAVMREERPISAPEARSIDALCVRRHAPPAATYRLQLNAGFTFSDAQRVVPYLHRLGISHLYVSPFMRARPGSAHGYDVTDHAALNPEIGDEAALASLSDALKALDMGLILDFVPNHMGIGLSDNELWLDVLEWGEASPAAPLFDIDWQSDKRELTGKALVPFLGDPYGTVLERGELTLRFDATSGTFSVWYFAHRFPIRPRHYALVIERALSRSQPPGDGAAADRLRELARAFSNLRPEGLGRGRQAEIHQRGRALQAELAALAREPEMSDWLSRAADTFAGSPGRPETFRSLHQLLERQAYRLASWRVAADEINYRRFFDVNDLIGIRQEVPEMFARTHRLVARLIGEDRIQGLRIDHIDGLFDPAAYCAALRALIVASQPGGNVGPENGRSAPPAARFFPIYVEKILAHNERLRSEWPVDGTTGYEFLALVNRLFINPGADAALDWAYRHFTGEAANFDEVLYAAKRRVMESLLASELNVLARQLDRISEQHWRTRDYTFERLRLALEETVAAFPVYRTYITSKSCSESDRRVIESAIARARRRWQGPDREILDFLRATLTLDLVRHRHSGYNRNDVVRFASRFQQYTAPVTAKGLEDTAGYRYTRFISLNEVGNEPDQSYASPGIFHAANEERRRTWPHAMLATATHDTKRGEDVRMRLDVITEIGNWGGIARRWRRFNRRNRREIEKQRVPSLTDEFLIYQTMIGCWPTEWAMATGAEVGVDASFRERIKGYVVKAVREAKLISNWTYPNEEYEQGCLAFVDAILDENELNLFMKDFRALVARVAFLGALNSLSQVVLKCFSPGFPDIYQGDELWDLNLVDPDNRRPVDFAERARMLADGVDSVGRLGVPGLEDAQALIRTWPDGRVKLYVLARSLMLRNRAVSLIRDGSYLPLRVGGARSKHVVAFARRQSSAVAVIAVGRLFGELFPPEQVTYAGNADWADTEIAFDDAGHRAFVDVFTGRRFTNDPGASERKFTAAELFATLPVVALVGEDT